MSAVKESPIDNIGSLSTILDYELQIPILKKKNIRAKGQEVNIVQESIGHGSGRVREQSETLQF